MDEWMNERMSERRMKVTVGKHVFDGSFSGNTI